MERKERKYQNFSLFDVLPPKVSIYFIIGLDNCLVLSLFLISSFYARKGLLLFSTKKYQQILGWYVVIRRFFDVLYFNKKFHVLINL